MEHFIKNIENLLSIWPNIILPERKKELTNILRDLKRDDKSEDLKKRAIIIGREAYPYFYAYFKIYNDCCRVKEEIGIHNFLKDKTQCSRFNKFLQDGGDIEKIRQGNVDEIYLTAEDIKAFAKAEAQVHNEAHQEVNSIIVKEEKSRFEDFVKEGEEKRNFIDKKISALRDFATENGEWGNEIFTKIDELEKRWVNFTNEPTAEDLDEVLDYYNSVIE